MALSAKLRTFTPKTAAAGATGPPYDVQACEIFTAGAVMAEHFVAGTVAGEMDT